MTVLLEYIDPIMHAGHSKHLRGTTGMHGPCPWQSSNDSATAAPELLSL